MAEVTELAAKRTSVIDSLHDGILRYVYNVSAHDGWQSTLGIRIPRESFELLMKGTRSMQQAHLWPVTDDFVGQVLRSGYTLSAPLPDFVLHEDVARKLLDGTELSFADVSASVVWEQGVVESKRN